MTKLLKQTAFVTTKLLKQKARVRTKLNKQQASVRMGLLMLCQGEIAETKSACKNEIAHGAT